jgi:NAD-dependent SIR2 family protein deacetylase
MDTVDATRERLHRWIAGRRRVFALTGAGCSTASGIPDYRDDRGEWKRRPPVMIQAFRADEAVYRRYWARACAGWTRFAAAAPGAAHRAFAAWEALGTLSRLVTQNVDGLHQRAGSRAVVDLHGRLDEVICLSCGARSTRIEVQATMVAANPGWDAVPAPAPDGDADIDPALIESFVAPRCDACGGLLKPDVVFFGENVPPARYEAARDALTGADGLLVAGSSLMVYGLPLREAGVRAWDSDRDRQPRPDPRRRSGGAESRSRRGRGPHGGPRRARLRCAYRRRPQEPGFRPGPHGPNAV